jgi:hypothetical protein
MSGSTPTVSTTPLQEPRGKPVLGVGALLEISYATMPGASIGSIAPMEQGQDTSIILVRHSGKFKHGDSSAIERARCLLTDKHDKYSR